LRNLLHRAADIVYLLIHRKFAGFSHRPATI
jgi:hypothetical protein